MVFSVRGRSLPNGTRDASHGCCSSSTSTFVVFSFIFDFVDFLSFGLMHADIGVATSIAMEEDGSCGTTTPKEDCATDPDGNNGAAQFEGSASDDADADIDLEADAVDVVESEDTEGTDEAHVATADAAACVGTDVDAPALVHVEEKYFCEDDALEDIESDVGACAWLRAACSSCNW